MNSSSDQGEPLIERKAGNNSPEDLTGRALRLRIRQQELLAELARSHTQLQAHAETVAELATTEERNRLARDIHDNWSGCRLAGSWCTLPTTTT